MLEIEEGGRVSKCSEKPRISEGWINGAFFVCEPGVFDYIEGDATRFERESLESLAADGELMAYPHDGFWRSMETLRDESLLNDLWDSNRAPWKTWND